MSVSGEVSAGGPEPSAVGVEDSADAPSFESGAECDE